MGAPATPFETWTKLRPGSSLRKTPRGWRRPGSRASRLENATPVTSAARPRILALPALPPSRLRSRPRGVAAATTPRRGRGQVNHPRMGLTAVHDGGEPPPEPAVRGVEEEAVVGPGEHHLVRTLAGHGEGEHLAALEARAERDPGAARRGAVKTPPCRRSWPRAGEHAAAAASTTTGRRSARRSPRSRPEGAPAVGAAQHARAVGAQEHARRPGGAAPRSPRGPSRVRSRQESRRPRCATGPRWCRRRGSRAARGPGRRRGCAGCSRGCRGCATRGRPRSPSGRCPLQAVANTVSGSRRSRFRVITSESSIIPVRTGRQLGPRVGGLPGQVPGADIEGPRVARIDGHGVHVADLRVSLGADAAPGVARVLGAEHAEEGARHEHPGFARSLGQGAHALALEAGRARLKVAPPSTAPRHAAPRPVHLPVAHVERPRRGPPRGRRGSCRAREARGQRAPIARPRRRNDRARHRRCPGRRRGDRGDRRRGSARHPRGDRRASRSRRPPGEGGQ